MISSRTNPKIKNIKKLLTSAKERKNTGLFVVEGVRLFSEVPGSLLDSAYISEDCKIEISGLKNAEKVEKNIFRELSDTVNPQGIMAVVKQPEWKIDIKNLKGKVLLLDGIRDPGNLGTIIRTAEAAGVSAVFMSPDCVDLFNPKVIRSTMGSIFRVPVKTMNLVSVISELKKNGMPVYGTSLKATKSYKEIDTANAGIVIGSEANGITDGVANAASDNVLIPMAGKVESLNAAVSAAILMFA